MDLDNDGLLDLVVLRYVQWDFDDIWCGEHKEGARAYCHPDTFKAIPPLVYHNEGKGRFKEVASKMGLGLPGKGLGIAIADYDRALGLRPDYADAWNNRGNALKELWRNGEALASHDRAVA